MIEGLKSIIKEYGSAIGPTLAFIFGILTLLIKYKLDQISARRTVINSFEMLKKQILDTPPPNYIAVDESNIQYYDVLNFGNLGSFNSNLIAISTGFETIDKAIIVTGDIQMIRKYIDIKLGVNKLIKIIEKIREKQEIEEKDFDLVKNHYHSMTISIKSPGYGYLYSLPNGKNYK